MSAICAIVRPGEIPDDWLTWPIEHAWHFLRATHGAHPFLPVPFGQGNHWEIGTIESERAEGSGDVATIEKDARGFVVMHPRGNIRLHPPRPWTLQRKLGMRVDRLVQTYRWWI